MNEGNVAAIQTITPRAQTKYVAWCDIMGSGNMMVRDFRVARYRVFQFQLLVLEISRKLTTLEVVPMSDGVFIVSEDFQGITEFINGLYEAICRSNQKDAKLERPPEVRFLARCGVAYGGISLGIHNTTGAVTEQDGFKEHFRTVLVGPALSVAYRGESSAPPMGVYLDRSVLQSPLFLVEYGEIRGPYYRWFEQSAGTAIYGETVEPYFVSLNKRSNELGVPKEKIDTYLRLAREYFFVPEDDNAM